MNLKKRLGVFLFAVGLAIPGASTACGEETPAPEKRAEPPAAEQKTEALKLVKDLFKDEYVKVDPAGQLALAKKLLEQGAATKDDAAARYVLFEEAWNLAISARDMDTALEAADRIGGGFEVDRLPLKMTAVERISRYATNREAHEIIANAYLKLVDEAVAADNFVEAPKLANLADQSARRAQSMPLLTKAQAVKNEVATQSRRYNLVRQVLQKLEQNPDDPQANLGAGRYYCFDKKNWKAGLPLLAKGSDAGLKKIAEEELKAPTAPAEQAALGDLWWDAAAKETTMKDAFRERGETWYVKALPGLGGLAQVKVKKQLQERHLAIGPLKAYLGDLEEAEAHVGWGKFGRNGDMGFQGLKVEVSGKAYEHGLSTSPGSSAKAFVRYSLRWGYRTLTGQVALNDSVPEKSVSKLTFTIIGDGRELWKSEPLDVPKKPQKFTVDVSGVDVLELSVDCPGKNDYAHTVWLDPQVSK